MTKVQAVFLDFGGTLVESLEDPYPVYRFVLEQRGLLVDKVPLIRAHASASAGRTPIAKSVLGHTDEYFRALDRRVLEVLGIEDPDGKLVDDLRSAFVSARFHRPFPESEGVLRELHRRGLPVHLVSNNTEDLLRTIAQLGWTSYFRSVSFSQEVGEEKPRPALFELALRRARRRPHEVLHVGDSWEADIEGARAIGLQAAWLHRGSRTGHRMGIPTLHDLDGLWQHLSA